MISLKEEGVFAKKKILRGYAGPRVALSKVQRFCCKISVPTRSKPCARPIRWLGKASDMATLPIHLLVRKSYTETEILDH